MGELRTILGRCEKCGSGIRVKTHSTEKTIPCPMCSVPVTVSAADAAPQAKPGLYTFSCPNCGGTLRAKPGLVGKAARCTVCEQTIRVPQSTASPEHGTAEAGSTSSQPVTVSDQPQATTAYNYQYPREYGIREAIVCSFFSIAIGLLHAIMFIIIRALVVIVLAILISIMYNGNLSLDMRLPWICIILEVICTVLVGGPGTGHVVGKLVAVVLNANRSSSVVLARTFCVLSCTIGSTLYLWLSISVISNTSSRLVVSDRDSFVIISAIVTVLFWLSSTAYACDAVKKHLLPHYMMDG